ncbi:MAG: HAMP domain-containing protein, partial [Chloroflexi bacterium]|nr:HAMP domain-containing protein [Chloroflexota bacterium]
MLKSIHFKMMIIYLLLILLAMELVGIYLLRSLEAFFINERVENLIAMGQNLSGLSAKYMTANPARSDIENLVAEFPKSDVQRVYVLASDGSLVSSAPAVGGIPEPSFTPGPEVYAALRGEVGKAIRYAASGSDEREQFVAVPVYNGESLVGAIYLVSSLKQVDETVRRVRLIVLSGTILALGVTGLLSLLLARSITGPIQELTRRAGEMAAGNFDQTITVPSQDEIGRLSQMFNHLTLRLRETLGQISHEKTKLETILTHLTDGVIAFD